MLKSLIKKEKSRFRNLVNDNFKIISSVILIF